MPNSGTGPTRSFQKRPSPPLGNQSPVDLRERTAADRLLQQEISRALEELADSLPTIADLRLPRLLSTIIEPSWREHTSFQDDVLFPIIARHGEKTGADDIEAALAALSAEHAELADRHGELSEEIERLISGALSNADMLGYLLRGIFDCRRRHIEAEARIISLVPPLLTPRDRATLDAWAAGRPAPPFPLNLVLATRG